MPYVKQYIRKQLKGDLNNLSRKLDSLEGPDGDLGLVTSGDMNYVLTELVLHYLDQKYYRSESGLFQYNAINDGVGILECAKLEFYRRAAAPKEDQAIKDNGDIPRYVLNLPVDGG